MNIDIELMRAIEKKLGGNERLKELELSPLTVRLLINIILGIEQNKYESDRIESYIELQSLALDYPSIFKIPFCNNLVRKLLKLMEKRDPDLIKVLNKKSRQEKTTNENKKEQVLIDIFFIKLFLNYDSLPQVYLKVCSKNGGQKATTLKKDFSYWSNSEEGQVLIKNYTYDVCLQLIEQLRRQQQNDFGACPIYKELLIKIHEKYNFEYSDLGKILRGKENTT